MTAMLPVTDVDRARVFYERLGWRLDIVFTTAQTDPLHGLFLLVDDIEATTTSSSAAASR